MMKIRGKDRFSELEKERRLSNNHYTGNGKKKKLSYYSMVKWKRNSSSKR